jgi:GntR family transcriptional regulator, transcriptional repressor for pyruvate dehydrogenase complex
MNEQIKSAHAATEHSVAGSGANNLAAHLKQSILDGQHSVGESLPSERELMAQFGVSRSTVREALRMLGAQGLVEVKRGRTGGSYVSNPPPELVVQSLTSYIKGHDIRMSDLVVAREAIECAAAAQAAIRRTEEQLDTLRQCCEACEEALPNGPAFVQANVDWHLAIVEASNNRLFVTFMRSISSAIHAATDLREFDLSIRKVVVDVHWQIFKAIQRGDPEAARRRMLRHLSAYGEALTSFDRA